MADKSMAGPWLFVATTSLVCGSLPWSDHEDPRHEPHTHETFAADWTPTRPTFPIGSNVRFAFPPDDLL